MNPYIEQANQQFVPVYNRYPIVLDHGEGMYLYDADGKEYLDFGSGIGVCALGYHDPNYTCLLQKQIEKLLHTSNLFYNVPSIEAAKLFNQAAQMEQVFFTNSGTEAIEGAIKIAKATPQNTQKERPCGKIPPGRAYIRHSISAAAALI